MNFEDILEIIKPRPSFWLRAWLFFFLLINRKEGKQLIETLIAKMEEFIKECEETHRKVTAYSDEVKRELVESQKKLKETQERARAEGY
jgi:hypothetical protein